MGLKDRLNVAKSEAELETLMNEGDTYTYASEKTRRHWRRNANNRYNALTTPAKEGKGKKTVAA